MIYNVHQRELAASPEAVGRLLDSLAGPDDEVWPPDWPPLKLDRPLAVGAWGGHGPVRYRVENYDPGRRVVFRFEEPAGFDGHHEYVVIALSERSAILRQTLIMRTHGAARLSWPLLYRPLHDALIEDSLFQAAQSLGLRVSDPPQWSQRVRLLRRLGRRIV